MPACEDMFEHKRMMEHLIWADTVIASEEMAGHERMLEHLT